MNDLDACRFQGRHVLLGATPCGFDGPDAAFPDGCNVFRIGRCAERRQKSQINPERLIGHFVTVSDLLCEQFRRPLRQSGDEAEAASIGHGRCHFGKAHIMHAALNDGMFDAEQFSNCCFHEELLLFCRAFFSMNDFQKPRGPHAATDTHGDDGIFRLAPTALNQSVAGQPSSGHAVGMPDRDRAAIDVELFRIDPELVAAIDHLYREGLVQFPEVDIVDLESVPLE